MLVLFYQFIILIVYINRVLNYALLGMLTILVCPYVWQRLPPLEEF